jgi:hypothetical protein
VKEKSKTPFYALAAVAVVGVGLGAYVMFLRPTPQHTVALGDTTVTAPHTATPDTAKQVPQQRRADTAAVSHRDTTTTAPIAQTPPPTTTPTIREPVRRREPDGTLSVNLTGTSAGTPAPANATILVDNRRGSFREKLTPGRHQVRIEAPGYQRFDTYVDIRSNRVTPVTVQLQALAAAVTTPRVGPTPGPTVGPTAAPNAGPAVDCANPQVGVRNANNVCYDTRPALRGTTLAMITPPASCRGGVRGATVLLKVSAAGEVESAVRQLPSNCPAFTEVAVAFAQEQLAFTPATKGGRPVVAWIVMLIRPSPR